MPTRRSLIGHIAGIAGTAGAMRSTIAGQAPSASAVEVERSALASGSSGAAVDIREFGAVGDGTTDDSDALSAAVAAVASRNEALDLRGGVVHVPPGVYALNRAVVVPKNIYLVGETPSASRLVYTGVAPLDVFIQLGGTKVISTYSGLRGLWVDANANARIAVQMYGPQEGSQLSDMMVTGATEVALDVRSDGIVGGSNKFSIERSWLWTTGNAGLAAVRLGADSGPVSIRDSTFVGTNRNQEPPDGSAGIIATESTVRIENVNAEHFESFGYFDRTHTEINTVTGFFNRTGIRTTRASTSATTVLTNAWFDGADNCVVDEGSGVIIQACRSYASDAYQYERRQLRHNFWEVGSANVWGSDVRQATLGFTSPANPDTERFKLTSLIQGRWLESASIDTLGVFGAASSAFDGPHIRLGDFHLWVDGSGMLRMKNGAPSWDEDGNVVGT